MGRACHTQGGEEKGINCFGWETEGRPSHKHKGNIEMDLNKLRCEGVNLIFLIQYKDQGGLL